MKTITAGGKHIAEVVSLPDGEQHKSLEVLQQVWDKALQSRLDRNSTFIALGGGVIGDMCGFAAAAYQRGVHFIQVRLMLACMHLCITLRLLRSASKATCDQGHVAILTIST